MESASQRQLRDSSKRKPDPMRLLLAFLLWFASIAYSIYQAHNPLIPCTTDSECMQFNGGDGSPATEE